MRFKEQIIIIILLSFALPCLAYTHSIVLNIIKFVLKLSPEESKQIFQLEIISNATQRERERKRETTSRFFVVWTWLQPHRCFCVQCTVKKLALLCNNVHCLYVHDEFYDQFYKQAYMYMQMCVGTVIRRTKNVYRRPILNSYER